MIGAEDTDSVEIPRLGNMGVVRYLIISFYV